jgi:hypothetical protein
MALQFRRTADETLPEEAYVEPGALALIGIFALAAVCALWVFLHGRSIERQLAAKGFEPCDDEASSLEGVWRALSASDSSQEVQVIRCRRRGGGRDRVHHYTVRERPVESQGINDTANPGTSCPVYSFNLRSGDPVAKSAVTLYVLPPGSVVLRKLFDGVIGLGESRPRLDVGAHSWSASIVAAYGDSPGALDSVVPPGSQQKLARAVDHGFFIIHLRDGKAAFVTLSNHRDVDSQLAYLAEWV